MTRKLNIFFFFFISLTANATSQLGDILIWKGDTLTLFSNPLELRSDWSTCSKIIDSLLMIEYRGLYPEKFETEAVESFHSTESWRGYIAEWTIIKDKIYLSNIYSCHNSKLKVDLKKVFGKELKDDLLFANWITDKLTLPRGKCLEYIDLGYESIYETETFIEFKNGILLTSKTCNNRVARKSKFSNEQNPNNYLDFIYTKINWSDLPNLENRAFQVFVGIQPDIDGKIDSIVWENTYLLENDKIRNDKNDIFIKEAIRIAALIPDWDVIYKCGIIAKRGFSITFSEFYKKKYTR